MAVIALRPLTLADGSKVCFGEPVPGADAWPGLAAWVRCGQVAHVADGNEQAFMEALRGNGNASALSPMLSSIHLLNAQRQAAALAKGTHAHSHVHHHTQPSPHHTQAVVPAPSTVDPVAADLKPEEVQDVAAEQAALVEPDTKADATPATPAAPATPDDDNNPNQRVKVRRANRFR